MTLIELIDAKINSIECLRDVGLEERVRELKALKKCIEQRNLALSLRDNTDMYDDATQKTKDDKELQRILEGEV